MDGLKLLGENHNLYPYELNQLDTHWNANSKEQSNVVL